MFSNSALLLVGVGLMIVAFGGVVVSVKRNSMRWMWVSVAAMVVLAILARVA